MKLLVKLVQDKQEEWFWNIIRRRSRVLSQDDVEEYFNKFLESGAILCLEQKRKIL